MNGSQSYVDTTKDISELFTLELNSDGSMSSQSIILIEGAPGIGKTILSKEILVSGQKGSCYVQ